jgi:hypothetical protein
LCEDGLPSTLPERGGIFLNFLGCHEEKEEEEEEEEEKNNNANQGGGGESDTVDYYVVVDIYVWTSPRNIVITNDLICYHGHKHSHKVPQASLKFQNNVMH